MGNLRSSTFLILVLRGLLVIAVLAIAPLYETEHAMTDAPRTMEMMPHMSAHEMSGGMTMDKVPPSHASHNAACRILCFGWVDSLVLQRPEGPVTGVALILLPAPAALLHGIAPSPNGHPPKQLRFV